MKMTLEVEHLSWAPILFSNSSSLLSGIRWLAVVEESPDDLRQQGLAYLGLVAVDDHEGVGVVDEEVDQDARQEHADGVRHVGVGPPAELTQKPSQVLGQAADRRPSEGPHPAWPARGRPRGRAPGCRRNSSSPACTAGSPGRTRVGGCSKGSVEPAREGAVGQTRPDKL